MWKRYVLYSILSCFMPKILLYFDNLHTRQHHKRVEMVPLFFVLMLSLHHHGKSFETTTPPHFISFNFMFIEICCSMNGEYINIHIQCWGYERTCQEYLDFRKVFVVTNEGKTLFFGIPETYIGDL